MSAMGMKSMILLRQGKFDQALEVSREIAERFGTDQPSDVLRAVRLTTAVVEVEGYQALGEHEKSLQACDEVVDLAGSDPDLEVRRGMALILRMKVQSLWALHRGDEVPPVCDDIYRRFGSDPDLILRQIVVQALLDKGQAYGRLGQPDDAAAVMDTILERYGEDPDPVLQEMSARARANKVALTQLLAGIRDRPLAP